MATLITRSISNDGHTPTEYQQNPEMTIFLFLCFLPKNWRDDRIENWIEGQIKSVCRRLSSQS